jgi:hypothetical protein
MGSCVVQFAGGTRLRTIQSQHVTLHDVGFGLGDLGESFCRDAECLRERLGIVSTHPVADAERAVFRIEPIVKSKDRVTRRRTEGLDCMTVAFGKIPEITRSKIDDLGYALWVDNRNLAMANDDVGPLRRIVCQCISRAPPAFMNRCAPAMSVAIGSPRVVISRAQPPDVALIGPLSREAVKTTASPDLRGTLQIFRCGGNVVSSGMSIIDCREGWRCSECAGTDRKRLKDDSTICFKHGNAFILCACFRTGVVPARPATPSVGSPCRTPGKTSTIDQWIDIVSHKSP